MLNYPPDKNEGMYHSEEAGGAPANTCLAWSISIELNILKACVIRMYKRYIL